MNLNLNKNNGEDCGCDNDYQNLVNSSPILSGSQESIFDPGRINSLNNKFNLNIKNEPIVFEKKKTQQIPKIDLEVLQQKKINDNSINMNIETNNSPNMNPAFQQQQNGMNAMNNALNNNMMNNNANAMNSLNNLNAMNGNAMNGNVMNGNAMNNNVMDLVNAMNNGSLENISVNSVNSSEDKKDGYKIIFTNINYIFMVILALAVNDIIKFYINRSIKFSNGSHYYFIYYGIAMFVIVVISSRLLHK